MDQIRYVTTKKEYRRAIEELQFQGYRVECDDLEESGSTTMARSTWGDPATHMIIFFICFWTLGFANLIYLLIASSNPDRVDVRFGDNDDDDESDDVEPVTRSRNRRAK